MIKQFPESDEMRIRKLRNEWDKLIRNSTPIRTPIIDSKVVGMILFGRKINFGEKK